jgi:AhpC/TSA family
MDRLRGRPMLIEFWDFCRHNSLRTLPYVRAWHERYEADGLQVVGIHTPGFARSRERRAVEAAVARLEIAYPVLLDPDLEMWREYENRGWPARYLFDRRGMLFHYHYGEGAYAETELAIQELLGLERRALVLSPPADAYRVPTSPRPYRALVGSSSEHSTVSSSRRSEGGPSSSTSTAPPGQ